MARLGGFTDEENACRGNTLRVSVGLDSSVLGLVKRLNIGLDRNMG